MDTAVNKTDKVLALKGLKFQKGRAVRKKILVKKIRRKMSHMCLIYNLYN